jgi:hypothetical protein
LRPRGTVRGDDDVGLENRLYPPPSDLPTKQWPQPDWAAVHRELRRPGVTLILLWEEYCDTTSDGFTLDHHGVLNAPLHLFAGKPRESGLDQANRITLPAMMPHTRVSLRFCLLCRPGSPKDDKCGLRRLQETGAAGRATRPRGEDRVRPSTGQPRCTS